MLPVFNSYVIQIMEMAQTPLDRGEGLCKSPNIAQSLLRLCLRKNLKGYIFLS